jgi:hypothetical protein
VRVFADDFGTAPTRPGRLDRGTARRDISGARSIVDEKRGGRSDARLRYSASGDLLWLCAETSYPRRPRAGSLRDRMLCELFADQVNVVRVTDA